VTAAPPTVNRRIIESLLETRLQQAEGRGGSSRLVLVHGHYGDASPAEFTVRLGDEQRPVRVIHQDSVLGIVAAWQDELAAQPGGSRSVLVVTTGLDDADLGADLRGHALGRRTLPVDRAEIVRQRFGAATLDPRIRADGWLVAGLLEAEPAEGWRHAGAAAAWRRGGGSLLTRDIAVRCLAEARLRLCVLASGAEGGENGGGESGEIDLDLLLAWSRTPAGPALFARLPKEERDGLAEWLREQAGEAAKVLLALAGSGRGADSMALGAVAAVLLGPAATDVGIAVGELFSGLGLRAEELRVYSAAVHGTLERWISEAESQRHKGEGALRRVLEVLERADELAAARPELLSALAEDAFLPSGFAARLRALAGALTGPVSEKCEAALARLADHRLARLFQDRCEVARMAVRLRRWLADVPQDGVGSVAQAVSAHVGGWGWVDRALTVLWQGDPAGDPVVGQAYQRLFEQARERRKRLDEAFAAALREWTAGAASQAPGGCLLVEDVLERIARPLATVGAPLVLLLDGMSSAVAAQLGEDLTARGWLEISPRAGARQAAVSMIPSVTTVSRASLLTGAPASGGQAQEKEGFAAFWARRGDPAALLLHMREVEGSPGHRLSERLLDALAGPSAVGVVLNTVDDTLDHGREGSRTGWRLGDIAFLEELLGAAHGYDRPVLLVADHGHILDRSEPGDRPAAAPGAVSARWRTGPAGPGEVELAGPRVLEGGGRVTAAWREDIRYTPRKAGYHGGASLAEMTVPLLVVLPPGAHERLPAGWLVLPAEQSTPSWWSAGAGHVVPAEPAVVGQVPAPVPKTKRRRPEPQPAGALFAVEQITAAPAPAAARRRPEATLGALVVGSKVYADQQRFVRKPPERGQVAAVIDALAAAGNHLSLPAVGAAAAAHGRAPRSPEVFVTMLERLLNVEGYPVIDVVDSRRTVKLDLGLLKEQFQLEEK
jgi:hypothetical protein